MKPEIVKIYLLGGSDGYTHTFTQNRAVLTLEEAEKYTAKSGYNVFEVHWAIQIESTYFLLDGSVPMPWPAEPLMIGLNTESEEYRKKKAALAKLTHEERKLLGLED